MPRSKKFWVACLNITVHPHEDGVYERLMKALAKVKSAPIYGDERGAINYLQPYSRGDISCLIGTFVRFTNLDPHTGWYDEENKTNIDSPDKGRPIIPPNFKPNRRETIFVFFPGPRHHKLFYICNSFSPTKACKLLSGLAEDKVIKKNFGAVNVEMMTTRDAIEQILRLSLLSSLFIRVNLPNNDHLSDEEQAFVDYCLDGQNVRMIQQDMRPKSSTDSIKPNDQTKAMMRVATIHGNGYVVAKGRDRDTGGRREISSRDHPDKREMEIDSQQTNVIVNSLVNLARKWLKIK